MRTTDPRFQKLVEESNWRLERAKQPKAERLVEDLKKEKKK